MIGFEYLNILGENVKIRSAYAVLIQLNAQLPSEATPIQVH
jgi:hypothetical protein